MRGVRGLVRARSHPARRTTAGIGALLLALVVALVPLPRSGDRAEAAEADSSAMTLPGTKGPYDDFSSLRVTVHQTEHLRNQGLEVSWTGGKPTSDDSAIANFLQVMQCWGDDPAGPGREQCVFGFNQPGGEARDTWNRRLVAGSDPGETEYTQDNGNFSPFVPFRPVEGAATDSESDTTYFGPNDTNAESMLKTGADGTGSAIFELHTALQAPHLGCGAVDASDTRSTPRSCWLVVVPRGEYEIEGDRNGKLDTSPLSRTNWDRRIVFPLGFDAVGDTCEPDKAERRIIGSELLTDAMSSWQTVLCTGGDTRFSFTQSGEDRARAAVTQPSATSPGLAVTVDPVEPVDGAATVVHAPLAVSGLALGFLWEDSGREVEWVRELRMTPRLLAKLLTQSYVTGVRFWSVDTVGPPGHLAGNPESLLRDPEFLALNPVMEGRAERSVPYGIVLPGENSDTNRLMWRYLQSDKDAREFLNGKEDPWGMKINPYYTDLALGADAPDHFPKADPTETRVDGTNGMWAMYTGAEIVPYAENLHDAAQRVRRGYSGQTTDVSLCQECASGGKLTGERRGQGGRRVMGLSDVASADRLRLDVVALPNADGEFVKPTNASLLKAVATMKDSAVPGVKAPDPARATGGAYPLTAVAYAAGSVDRPEAEREDYARMIRYAAGAGQTQGLVPGQLPPGYAPLPAAMREQAVKAATDLEKGVVTAPAGSSGAEGGSSAGGDGAGTGGGLSQAGSDRADAGGATTVGGGADASAAPDGSAPPGTSAGSGQEKTVASSGGLTPADILGAVRWVLLGVLIAGAAAALAGPVMLRLSVRKAAVTAD
ncbi:hypothetical protein [Streptomyces sp. NPDC048590]|uniref:hypothetical protein n=1 Tax=Streptomyces sp. NPDC048590 TaxID=3365574 RepID=UPI003719FC6F